MTIVTNNPETVRAHLSPESGRFSEKITPVRWSDHLKQAVRDPAELCRILSLPESYVASARAAARQFPLFVTRPYLSRVQPGDPADPLLRQVVPLAEENEEVPGFTADPVGDAAAIRAAGLLQKYEGRALLIATGACAVHCRYCFRRHFPYSDAPSSFADWQPALDEIRKDASLEEIILSGGDPLTLTDGKLTQLIQAIDAIGHMTRLRIHTRLPIFIPSRVNDELCALLGSLRVTPVVVLHVNHAAEIDSEVAQSIARLRSTGAMLLNQSVLLRGVNDSAETLANLSRQLGSVRVQPYYLHQLDRTAGAAHFEVPVAQGLKLMQTLAATLPGYLVPKYVQEIPGGSGKQPILPKSW